MLLRVSWDEYFINIASVVASRSTCDRAQVGTVLVRENRLLTTGFNGSVSGLEHCDDIGHLMVEGHCIRTVHSEANAIIQAVLHGVSTAGATAYITHTPCMQCAKMLINAGIARIVYLKGYRTDENAIAIIRQSGVNLDCFEGVFTNESS